MEMANEMKRTQSNGFARLTALWLLMWVAAAGLFFYRAMPKAWASPQRGVQRASILPIGGDGSRPAPAYRTKNIEDIKVGDYVLAKDPDRPGGPTAHRVLATPVNYTKHVVHIQVGQEGKAGGELRATREHPFFASNRGWVNANDLQAGDQLQDTEGQLVTVAGIQIEDKTCDTFNLTVEGMHTFYVLAGDTPVLVHNVNPGDFGNYGSLRRAVQASDGVVIHHMPQAHPAGQIIPGYQYKNGLAVAVDRTEHVRSLARTNLRGSYSGSAEELVDKGINDLKQNTSLTQDQIKSLENEAKKRYCP